jgi:hypothetical protein
MLAARTARQGRPGWYHTRHLASATQHYLTIKTDSQSQSQTHLHDDADHALLRVLHLVIQRAGHLLLQHRALRLRCGVHCEAAREHQAGCGPHNVHVDVLASLHSSKFE